MIIKIVLIFDFLKKIDNLFILFYDIILINFVMICIIDW